MSSLHRERERAARGPLIPSWLLVGLVLVGIVATLAVIGLNNKGKSPPPAASTPSATTTQQPNRRTRHRTQQHKPVAAPKPTTVTLQLVPTGQVYVCLVNGRGTKLIPGQIFARGQTIPTQKAAKLLLTLGNAAVQMKVNGKIVHVSPTPSSIGYSITPSGMTPLPVSQQPTCA
jgi:hypothetical protein